MNEKELRAKLTSSLIGLGQMIHFKERSSGLGDPEISKISNEICQLEKQLYEVSGYCIPKREDLICPYCSSAYDEGSVFCGDCGQNIADFYESLSEDCKVCNSIINNDATFCGVCGSKR